MIVSSSGSVIHFGPLDAQKWAKLLEDGHFSQHHEIEFYRRFLLGLLQPLFPHQADDLVQHYFNGRFGHYHVIQHLKNSPNVFFFNSDSCCASSGDLLRHTIRNHMAYFLSIQALQDLGYIRLARMCYIERNRMNARNASRAHVVLNLGAFWMCRSCRFPNQNMEQASCAACHKMRCASQIVGVPEFKERFVEPLEAEEALRMMKKLRKKLKQVRSTICDQQLNFNSIRQRLRRVLFLSSAEGVVSCYKKTNLKKFKLAAACCTSSSICGTCTRTSTSRMQTVSRRILSKLFITQIWKQMFKELIRVIGCGCRAWGVLTATVMLQRTALLPKHGVLTTPLLALTWTLPRFICH
jgi:hypothetical protein